MKSFFFFVNFLNLKPCSLLYVDYEYFLSIRLWKECTTLVNKSIIRIHDLISIFHSYVKKVVCFSVAYQLIFLLILS